MRRHLAQAVDDIGNPFGDVVRLRYLEGLSCAEIARRRGVSASTVRSQSRRGLELLRQDLEKEYGPGRGLTRALILAFDWEAADLPASLASSAPVESGARGEAPWWASPRAMTSSFAGVLLVAWALWAPASSSGESVVEARVKERSEPSPALPLAADAKRVPLLVDTPPTHDPAPPEAPSGQRVLVVDDAGLPVEGAEILVGSDDPTRDYQARATSDHEGLAVVAMDETDAYPLGGALAEVDLIRLLARAPGKIQSDVLLVPGVTDRTLTIELGGPDRVVEGRVTDASGEPVAGTWVYVGSFEINVAPRGDGTWVHRAMCRARSAADGTYRVAGIRPGLHPVVGEKDGWARAHGQVDLRGESRATCDLGMNRGAVLRGRVFDPDGRPQAGAWVVEDAMQRQHPVEDTTDEQGRYELRGLEPIANRFNVFGPDDTWDELLWTPRGDEREHDFHLRTGREVSVRVVDASGTPIPDVRVQFLSDSAVTWRHWAATDADGRAKLVGAPIGRLQALVLSPAGDTRTIARFEWPGPDGEEGHVVYRPELDELATIRGVCVRHDGTLWDDARIAVTELGVFTQRFSRLDPATGAFEMSVQGGPLVIELMAQHQGATRIAEVELSPGEDYDVGILRCEEPGWLETECSFEGDPATYRHRVVYTGPSGHGHVVLEGAGFPPRRLELLPGEYAVFMERGSQPFAPRGGLVRSGGTHHQRLFPGAPVTFGFHFQAPPGCSDRTAQVVLTRLADEAHLPDERAPLDDHFATLWESGGEQARSVLVERGPDDWFSCELDMTPGNWSVLAETASGWLAAASRRIDRETACAYRECELVLPD